MKKMTKIISILMFLLFLNCEDADLNKEIEQERKECKGKIKLLNTKVDSLIEHQNKVFKNPETYYREKGFAYQLWLDVSSVDGNDGGYGGLVLDQFNKLKFICSLETLQKNTDVKPLLKGKPVLVSGVRSNTTFRHYNPEFIKWVNENLIPGKNDHLFKFVTQAVYDGQMKEFCRIMHLYSLALQCDDRTNEWYVYDLKTKIKNDESIYSYEEPEGNKQSVQNIFKRLYKKIPLMNQNIEYHYSWSNSGMYTVSFWIRREIDGSRNDVSQLLNDILQVYDSKFYDFAENAFVEISKDF